MKKEILTFENVYLNQASSLVGKKEYEGPLGYRFDAFEKDEYFGTVKILGGCQKANYYHINR